MRSIRISAVVLGSMSLAFGLLKFTDPFKAWYATQIETSGLPPMAYALGIGGEIVTGLLFLLPALAVLSGRAGKTSLLGAHVTLAGIMAVACYVHLVPAVPADVLPLKIKPPYIPALVLIYTLINLVRFVRQPPSKN